MPASLVHKHIILRIEAKKPPGAKELNSWVSQLVEKIGMKILEGPISANITTIPGNCGPTCVCIIETSHIVMHICIRGVEREKRHKPEYCCPQQTPCFLIGTRAVHERIPIRGGRRLVRK